MPASASSKSQGQTGLSAQFRNRAEPRLRCAGVRQPFALPLRDDVQQDGKPIVVIRASRRSKKAVIIGTLLSSPLWNL